jgi:hypothetical protein
MANMLDRQQPVPFLPFSSRTGGVIMKAMKSRASTTPPANAKLDSKLKFGLPGTPEERRQEIRALMKKHAQTLRRLAR